MVSLAFRCPPSHPLGPRDLQGPAHPLHHPGELHDQGLRGDLHEVRPAGHQRHPAHRGHGARQGLGSSPGARRYA